MQATIGRSQARPNPLPCCSTRSAGPATCDMRTAVTACVGETLLLLVPHNHRNWLEEGGRWEFFWISMNGEEALRIHRAFSPSPVHHKVAAGNPSNILPTAAAPHRRRRHPGQRLAIAYEAAMALYDDVFGSHPVLSDEYRKMQHVIDHVLGNLDKPLPVEELAAHLGLSRAHFSRSSPPAKAMPPGNSCCRSACKGRKLLTKTRTAGQGSRHHYPASRTPNYFAKVFAAFRREPTEFPHGMYASVSATGPQCRPNDSDHLGCGLRLKKLR